MFRPLLLLLTAVVLSACGGGDQSPQISKARVVLPPPGMQMAAGYFELENPGSAPLRVLSVKSSAFKMAEIHQTVIEDGLSKMREVEDVVVPAGQSKAFEPGGWHIMLMGYVDDPAALETLPVEIELQAGDAPPQRQTINFAVESVGGGR